MLKLIKMEFGRVFTSRSFFAAVMTGCVCAALAFFDTPGFKIAKNWYLYMQGDANAASIIEKVNMVDTPLEIWMPRYGASSTFYYSWITILPILTTIPFAVEYAKEKKNGLINQYAIRVTKKKYYISKFITTFVSGGLVTVIPHLFNLLIVMCFLTWRMPLKMSGLYPVTDTNVFNEIFYNYPALYIIIFILYIFVMFGLLTCLCLSFTLIEDNLFTLMITPFIVYFAEHVFISFGAGVSNVTLLANSSLYITQNASVKALALQLIILILADAVFFSRIRKDVL